LEYVVIGVFVIVLIRAWFLMGKISQYITDTEYRDIGRFKERKITNY